MPVIIQNMYQHYPGFENYIENNYLEEYCLKCYLTGGVKLKYGSINF